jgi:holin-like protein
MPQVSVGFLVLFAFQAAGEAVVRVFALPFPGAVVGMGLLTLALVSGLVRERWVARAADLLLDHLALFVYPVIVGVVDVLPLLRAAWAPIVFGNVLSTAVVLVAAAWPFALGRGKGAA